MKIKIKALMKRNPFKISPITIRKALNGSLNINKMQAINRRMFLSRSKHILQYYFIGI